MATNQGISFLYSFDLGNRLVDNFGSNVIRVSSTKTGDFDKGNVTSESVREVWRSDNVLTLQEIVIKADIKSEIDTFAILGHNFSIGAVVKVEANIDDVWIAPPFSQQVVVDEEVNNIILANGGFGGEYEYYRVTVLDPSNACGYIEIGRIVGGQAFTFENNEDITDTYKIANVDQSEKMKTQGYFRASNENIIVRSFSANFSKLFSVTGQDDNFRGFRRLWKTVKTTRPFLTVLDRDNTQIFNVWGQFKSLPDESFGINQFVNTPVSIEEVF